MHFAFFKWPPRRRHKSSQICAPCQQHKVETSATARQEASRTSQHKRAGHLTGCRWRMCVARLPAAAAAVLPPDEHLPFVSGQGKESEEADGVRNE